VTILHNTLLCVKSELDVFLAKAWFFVPYCTLNKICGLACPSVGM